VLLPLQYKDANPNHTVLLGAEAQDKILFD
jgi:hypothetical protein